MPVSAIAGAGSGGPASRRCWRSSPSSWSRPSSSRPAGRARSRRRRVTAGSRSTKAAATTPAPPDAPNTGSYRGRVPILMYHVVTAAPAGTAYPELWTPRETFRSTIALLKREGYRGVTLGQVWNAWHGGQGPPGEADRRELRRRLPQPVHARQADVAGRRLAGRAEPRGQEHRARRPDRAPGPQHDRRRLGDRLAHDDPPGPDDRRRRAAARTARLLAPLLRRTFDVPVDFFCYPAGRNDARVRAAVRAAGYKAATTVDPGIARRADDPYAAPADPRQRHRLAATVLQHLRTGTGAAGAYA